jgi:hypothetical protein
MKCGIYSLIAFSLVLLLTSCLSVPSIHGEKADPADRSMQVTGDVEGKAAADLYAAAGVWFADAFNSAEAVIEYQDKDAGVIAGTFNFTYAESVYELLVRSDIKVEVKDGRYRVTFDNPRYIVAHISGTNAAPSEERIADTATMISRTREKWRMLAESLDKALTGDGGSW